VSTFDQRGQKVDKQTNIAGNSHQGDNINLSGATIHAFAKAAFAANARGASARRRALSDAAAAMEGWS